MSNLEVADPTIKICIVIPVRNVESMIESVLEQIFLGLVNCQAHIIILDNASTDATRSEIDQVRSAFERSPELTFNCIYNEENLGYGGSLKKGLSLAKKSDSEWVMVAHGDDQADWKVITQELLHQVRSSKNDLFLTSRFMNGTKIDNYSLRRRLGNRAFRIFTNLLLTTKMTDPGAAILVIRKDRLNLDWLVGLKEDFLFHPGLNIIFHKARLNIKEVPMNWRDASHPGDIKLIKYGLSLLFFILRTFLRRRVHKMNWIDSVAYKI